MMKRISCLMLAILASTLLFLLAAPGTADAWWSYDRWGNRYWVPGPYPYPYTYPYPYAPYVAPPVVVPAPQPQQPVPYMQQPAPAQQAQPQYWQYCKSAGAYYPYVKECPEGWLQVLPQVEPQQPPKEGGVR